MFTHKTYCLFNCWLYGIGIRFNPNNLKRKARCGSDLLEYVQVNKIMQKMRKRKVRKHLKVQEKCSKIVKHVTNYKAALVRFLHRSNRFFTSLRHGFTQRSDVYNFCPNENKSFHRISSVSKHRSFTKKSWLKNREMESENKPE